jgi:hypothetical protein
MYLVPFFVVDPDLAVRETRTLTLFEPHDAIPAGQYALVESYCSDPECDCQRVMLNVVEEQRPTAYLASISYGFDRGAEHAGPYLDPLNYQGRYAKDLMRLVEELALSDPAYVARLKRHYALVKRAAADPNHPAYHKLQDAIEKEEDELLVRVPGPEPQRVGRNDPCPCGSGIKYKHCCGRKGSSR